MANPIDNALTTLASGMNAQSKRIQTISENMAHARTTAGKPGEDPYRRKVLSFQSLLDKDTGARRVVVNQTLFDRSDFPTELRPGDPAANEKGFVKLPNVNTLGEFIDLNEARQQIEAQVKAYETALSLAEKTNDLFKL